MKPASAVSSSSRLSIPMSVAYSGPGGGDDLVDGSGLDGYQSVGLQDVLKDREGFAGRHAVDQQGDLPLDPRAQDEIDPRHIRYGLQDYVQISILGSETIFPLCLALLLRRVGTR